MLYIFFNKVWEIGMKKIITTLISFVLIVALLLPMTANAAGATITAKTPVIYISGDSNYLEYTKEDGSVNRFSIDSVLESMIGQDDEGDGTDLKSVMEAMFNILSPAITEGLTLGKWDRYYDAVYKEISDFMGPIQLDNDGNPKPGSGICAKDRETLAYTSTHDMKEIDGRYREKSYIFYYDWRLDPRTEADELNKYIEAVKAATGSDKVSISARCLGCNVIMCYIDKYGTDSLKGVALDVATSMGAEFLSGMISGDFALNGNSISRYIKDAAYFWQRNQELVDMISCLLEILDDSGILNGVTQSLKEGIYSQIEYGLISALSRAFMMTYPAYWAIIPRAQFEKALEYVFGKEGDKKRTEYAGLIENIVSYNNDQKTRITDIYSELEKNNVNVCIISKYGVQLLPVIENADIIADQYCSAYSSSLGATTADSIFHTLPESYIAEKEAQGLGRYISPDDQIDASTCLFPDYTWFFKGVMHGYYSTDESNLLMTVIDADHQYTVNDFENYPQFNIYHTETSKSEPMTKSNCHIEFWYDKVEENKMPEANNKISFIKQVVKFFGMFFRWAYNAIKEKLG